MKQNFLKWSVVLVATVLAVSTVRAQETNEVEQLRQELREMRKRMQLMEQKLGNSESKSAVPAVAIVAEIPPPAKKTGSYMDIGMVTTFAA